MARPKKETPDAVRVVVADAVSDGAGGFLPVGAVVEGDAETIASLVAKGLAG